MRRYRIEITHRTQLVYASEVIAMNSAEAIDEAWRGFDPGGKIGALTDGYETSAEEL